MAISVIWTIMLCFSLVYGAVSGRAQEVGAAAMEGAGAAVSLCIATAGAMALWSGVMEIMRKCGLLAALSRLLRPVLARLYPTAARNSEVMEDLSANVSANLLGLGNAATPAGIRAATGMLRCARDKSAPAGTLNDSRDKSATDELCLLVVMNTASIQLLPTTVAALRAAAGSSNAFDILPAVWVTSLCSVTAGILAAKLLEKVWDR